MAGIYGRKGIVSDLCVSISNKTSYKNDEGLELTASVVSLGESDVEQRRTRATSTSNKNNNIDNKTNYDNDKDKDKSKESANRCHLGCVICFEDNDHSNLLLCESCDAEYHIYCLQPPLRSVPEGDFHCEKCKPFVVTQNSSNRSDGLGASGYEDIVTRSGRKQNMVEDDGVDEMVNALPPKFTTRFGDISWAAGGVGFGWWPAFIYDPRLSIGVARTLARKNLGKKHLVYFFECHDGPFTVLSSNRLVKWEDGLMEEFDIGKTSKGIGKVRYKAFQKALMLARIELDKPKDMRMYSYCPKLTPPKKEQPTPNLDETLKKKQVADGKTDSDSNQNLSEDYETTTRAGNTYKRSCRTTSRIASYLCTESLDEKKALARAIHLSACEAKLKNNDQTFIYDNEESSTTQNKKFKLDNEIFLQILIMNHDGQPSSSHDNSDHPTSNTNTTDNTSTTGAVDQSAVPNTVQSSSNPIMNPTNNPNNATIIGFIPISISNYSALTFSNARTILQTELDEDMLPNNWKFYIPALGPLSIKQEEKNRLLDFISSISTSTTGGNTAVIGSKFSPFQIFIMNCCNITAQVAMNVICTATNNDTSVCSASLSDANVAVVAKANDTNNNTIYSEPEKRTSSED